MQCFHWKRVKFVHPAGAVHSHGADWREMPVSSGLWFTSVTGLSLSLSLSLPPPSLSPYQTLIPGLTVCLHFLPLTAMRKPFSLLVSLFLPSSIIVFSPSFNIHLGGKLATVQVQQAFCLLTTLIQFWQFYSCMVKRFIVVMFVYCHATSLFSRISSWHLVCTVNTLVS